MLRFIFFSSLLLVIVAVIVVKAARAIQIGGPYRFGFVDGGLLLQGKETSPRLMLGVAVGLLMLEGAALVWAFTR